MTNSWGVRSLAVKLTLAFLAVGLITLLGVGLIVGAQTQRDFNRFVRDRFEASTAQSLTNYYAATGSWNGVDILFRRGPGQNGGAQDGNPPGEEGVNIPFLQSAGISVTMPIDTPGSVVMRAPITIVGVNGKVVYSADVAKGALIPAHEIASGIPLTVSAERVGTLLIALRPPDPVEFDEREASFLNQTRRTILWGSLGALLIAVSMGGFIAKTLTRPLRKLTEATQDVARGNLGRQVEIESKDELGDLARSFNHMSSDLAQSVNLRRQMTADIAHDLRTPLSVILGYTEALDEGVLPPSAETYAILHDEARHLSRLVDDLRTLSLAEAGELRLERSPTSPADLLGRVAAAHKVQADHAGVTLVVDASPNLPTMQVDAERFAQVLHNLVSNALRYTPNGGTITLGARQQIDGIALTVRDTGAGIAAEHLPFVFERFYRADAARQQTGESGLGLPIAKSIVEMHGGTITVASEVGTGTIFTIHLRDSPSPTLNAPSRK